MKRMIVLTGTGIPMAEQWRCEHIKAGPGLLVGISNQHDQPGKMLTVLDGEIVLCRISLNRAFPDRVVEEDGLRVMSPGMLLDSAFMTGLYVQTDGEVKVYWG